MPRVHSFPPPVHSHFASSFYKLLLIPLSVLTARLFFWCSLSSGAWGLLSAARLACDVSCSRFSLIFSPCPAWIPCHKGRSILSSVRPFVVFIHNKYKCKLIDVNLR
ncbi:hypothetical protein B0H11DRAFT_690547 [Mycena galericulata]|nr:hypothetical protein B0H11DRAFT_690547 [Mycena galericulata]